MNVACVADYMEFQKRAKEAKIKLRCDEAIDLYGHKTRVKWCGWYNRKNHIEGDYYLFYDEKEVYHIENSLSKKIVQTFGCDSWDGAIERAKMILNALRIK